jgi:preprotein translocase subunit SecA
MFKNLLSKIVGDANDREVKGYQPLVAEINALESEMQARSNEDLQALTEDFRSTMADETSGIQAELDDLTHQRAQEEEGPAQEQLTQEIDQVDERLRKVEAEILQRGLPQAFAAVREASRRTTGLRHFDVQLVGGMVLHQGKVAEMKTGEGKTLVATLPVYLNALAGRGVHVVTVNDYLAKRDTQWMGPIYQLLGLSVGVIQHDSSFVFDPDYTSTDERYQFLRPVERRDAYHADITYGTNNEFGFDYLRDNMAWDLGQCVQRQLNYAIVDEVDNILIDEARTPLIISGTAEESSQNYRRFADLTPRLRRDEDYTVEEKQRIVMLTEAGLAKMEGWLGIENLYSAENYDLTPYMDNALRAQVIYQRDRDYIVKDGQVIIVDEFTGRLMYGRRYSEGLHQAIEAKEGMEVQRESLTLAPITF